MRELVLFSGATRGSHNRMPRSAARLPQRAREDLQRRALDSQRAPDLLRAERTENGQP